MAEILLDHQITTSDNTVRIELHVYGTYKLFPCKLFVFRPHIQPASVVCPLDIRIVYMDKFYIETFL